MTFVDHFINHRMSQFWSISDEQQALSAVEIVSAAERIRQLVWRDGTPSDPILKEHKQMLIANLLRFYPMTICVVHDNEREISKRGLLEAFQTAFKVIGDKPAAVGLLDIFIVLVLPGENKFVGLDFFEDEKPSERLLQSGLHFVGHASTPKEAWRLMVNAGMFQKD